MSAVSAAVQGNRNKFSSEDDLIEPLVAYLLRRRLLRSGSMIATKVHLHGKWVDMATLTSSGSLSTFELKLNHITRVLEQAAANTLSADRSYVVTSSKPGASSLEQARTLGLGVLHIDATRATRLLLRAPKCVPDGCTRNRLRTLVQLRGDVVPDVQRL